MEAQCGSGVAAAGGEMRKIHIIYFISRKGRTEHPHLIRVHHHSKNGVRLRDVKRWLSELRGKDMPDSFAWSYKRKYKTGYLWQDLLDEDLITPISDNEYVLKGSEIPSFNLYLRSPGKSRASFHEDEIQEHPKSSTMEASTCEIEEESPKFGSETSTVTTDDATKLEEEKKNSGENKPETPRKGEKIDNISLFWSSKNSSKNTKKNDASNVSPNTPASSSTPRSSSEFTKSKSYSANVFRNLLTCGAMDTNETAMVTINRREKSSCYGPPKKPADVENIAGYGNSARICRGDKLGGSERLFRTSWHQEQKPHPDARKSCDGAKSSSNGTKNEFSNLKPVSVAYKPINGPNCAQCGKMFKPEKMHKHMKSCRGLKYLAKGATSASVLDARRSSVDSACKELVSGYFLTNGSEFQ